MKVIRVCIFFVVGLLIASSSFNRRPRLVRAQSDSSQGTPCCSAVAPRQLEFPYYSLRDGFESTLLLVSDSPKPLDFVMAVHSRSGRTLLAPTMTIQPQQKLPVSMSALLGRLSADATGEFSEGSVSIYFNGTIMPLAGQLTMTDPAQGLVLQTEMVDNSPGLGLLPPVLNGLWWGLGAGRAANIAVSNTGEAAAVADVFLDFQGERHDSPALLFGPRETKVLSIAQLLADLKFSPSQVPEGGVTIVQRGAKRTLVAQGKITDPATGFSASLNFLDPTLQKANALHASGVPIGFPGKGSPYAGAGLFVPHVVVRNLTGAAQVVSITLEYPGESETQQTALAPLPLGPYSTADIAAGAALASLPSPVPFCSIRIQYSGPPGSAIAEVASVESKSDLVIDGRLANEGDGWAGSGAHPWHLDDETESVLFLTNMGDKDCRMGFQVQAGGVLYYLVDLALKPHETKPIDIRKLRDAQKADFRGHLIPADAADGSVLWIHIDEVPVMGRLVEIKRHKGVASSYQCQSCPCGTSYNSLFTSPTSASDLPSTPIPYYAEECDVDCNGNPYYWDITSLSSWASDNVLACTVNNTTQKGMATVVGGGTANINATYTGIVRYWDGMICHYTMVQRSGGGTCNGQVPGYVGLSSSTGDTVRCGTSQFFARRLQVRYQVRDSSQTKSPILKAGMTASEELSWSSGICSTSDGCGQKPSAGSWSTDANGMFTDSIYNCSSTCVAGGSCTENWQQKFKVNSSAVGIVNGGVTGSLNCIATNCTATPQGTTH